jgi:hypothetical protein
MLTIRQIILADISGMVAGVSTLSAPKNASTNEVRKSAPAQTLKSLVKMRIAA